MLIFNLCYTNVVVHFSAYSLLSPHSLQGFTRGLEESFKFDVLPDTTLYFVWAGDRHRDPDPGPHVVI